ncbi:hypothetical protein EV421DRAFT_2039044 [Armillaria borealis]|uniref:F-box domain-containing protein n=1 Tax=Armillaria borealis TaxID=47425 RepID=A0AA39J3X9_9AGAR|nr:hypothetical protein EV421DRAFT_2039044 [Armillaria borealis]
MLGMSTSDVAILSTSLKKLFDVKRLTASLVSSILRAANRRLVCAPAGNTFVIPNSISPISTGIVPLVIWKRDTTGDIAGKQKLLEELSAHRAALSAAEKPLNTLRSILATDIAQYKKALHPIRRLPPEVLSEIFLQCIDENGTENEASRFLDATPSCPKNSLDPSQCPWTLSKVCSKWRAISLSFPRLWSNIHLHVRDKKPRKSIRTLNLQLHRSGTHALKVAFTVSPMKDLPPITEVLISSCLRWKTLFLSIPEICMSQIAHIEGSLPILGALYIMPPIPSSPMTGDSFFAFRNTPSLRTIGGDINILGRCNLPWPQIKSVIYPPLGDARFLEGHIPPNTMAITAPHLVSLEISTFAQTPSILGHLILPSLRSFSISGGSQGVAALIERSKCPLQKLEIGDTRSTLECQNLLAVMPASLETFTSTIYGNKGYGDDDLRSLVSATSHIQHMKSVDLTYTAGHRGHHRNLSMTVLDTGYPVLTVKIPGKTVLPFPSRIYMDSDSDE